MNKIKMPIIEKIHWLLSAIAIVLLILFDKTALSFVMELIIGVSSFVCWLYIRIKSDIDPLLYKLDGNKDTVFIPIVDIERVLNEIESGNICVPPKQLKYIESARRIGSYGVIPFILIALLEWFNI